MLLDLSLSLGFHIHILESQRQGRNVYCYNSWNGLKVAVAQIVSWCAIVMHVVPSSIFGWAHRKMEKRNINVLTLKMIKPIHHSKSLCVSPHPTVTTSSKAILPSFLRNREKAHLHCDHFTCKFNLVCVVNNLFCKVNSCEIYKSVFSHWLVHRMEWANGEADVPRYLFPPGPPPVLWAGWGSAAHLLYLDSGHQRNIALVWFSAGEKEILKVC